MIEMLKNQLFLGNSTTYQSHYEPNLLFPISRANKREEIGITEDNIPFYGFDVWNHYEVSWLNSKGKPCVGVAEMIYDANSKNIIESKSMKLYFNSFNQTQFLTINDLQETIEKDIAERIDSPVKVDLKHLHEVTIPNLTIDMQGVCLDLLEVNCDEYQINKEYLLTENKKVSEKVYSHLLKANCLVTGQPDWASIQIEYSGNQINHEGLLKYIVSFRNHQEFHEQCIERLFMDIMEKCQPNSLTVEARFTRRGGIDINPIRSTEKIIPKNQRLVRQ